MSQFFKVFRISSSEFGKLEIRKHGFIANSIWDLSAFLRYPRPASPSPALPAIRRGLVRVGIILQASSWRFSHVKLSHTTTIM